MRFGSLFFLLEVQIVKCVLKQALEGMQSVPNRWILGFSLNLLCLLIVLIVLPSCLLLQSVACICLCPKKIVFWKEMPHTVQQLSFQNLVEVGPRSAQGQPKVGPKACL